jgi:predicted DNA-binding protein (UPF0251 family)
MSRPRKPRTCACPQRAAFEAVYKPAGIPLKELEKVQLFHDELEALYLCDAEGKTQEQAGCCMGVSRGTVQRLVTEARRKMVYALVGQQALVIAPKASDVTPNKGEEQ